MRGDLVNSEKQPKNKNVRISIFRVRFSITHLIN